MVYLRRIRPWLLAVLLVAWQHGHAVPVRKPADAPAAAAASAPVSAEAFDAMHRQLNDLGLATQPSHAQVLERLAELASLRPAGESYQRITSASSSA